MATAPELYDVAAQIVKSEAQAGVSSATRVYAFGSCPIGDLNTVVPVTSVSDAAQKLGCAPGDGYSLSEIIVAAFEVVGLGQVLCIPVSHEISYTDAWKGDAALETGVYTYEKCIREDPGTVNILVAPSVVDKEFLSAMLGLCQSQDGIKSYMIYDVPGSRDQIDAGGFAKPDPISAAKKDLIQSGYATAVWGNVRTSGGYSISGAAVRACMQALNDSENQAPSRVGGNLPLGGVVGIDGQHFGSSGKYPLFLNLDSTVSAGSAAALESIFPNAILSSHPLSYSLSKMLPMFAKDIHGVQFPAHLVMQSGEIRKVDVTMDNTNSTWSFNPSGVENNEAIVALIGYKAIDEGMLLNPVVIPISAIYQGVAIDLTGSLSEDIDYVAGSDGVVDYLTIIPQSVKVGGVGFVYDETLNEGAGAIVKDLLPILNGASGKPVVEGAPVFGIYEDDIPTFYAHAEDDRYMDIRKGAYVDLIKLRKVDANSLSADGVCSVLCKYGTQYTWGDHTSAFVNNKVADERDRFENQMRMLQYICNWFLLTFGVIIDDGMTLQLRNDIIGATQAKLNGLVALGALIGQPRCTFEAANNPKDEIAMGHFVFDIRVTGTIPTKYLKAKVRYTDEGLSIYSLEAA